MRAIGLWPDSYDEVCAEHQDVTVSGPEAPSKGRAKAAGDSMIWWMLALVVAFVVGVAVGIHVGKAEATTEDDGRRGVIRSVWEVRWSSGRTREWPYTVEVVETRQSGRLSKLRVVDVAGVPSEYTTGIRQHYDRVWFPTAEVCWIDPAGDAFLHAEAAAKRAESLL